jgi:16S rRNA (cytidine1402-2'-O)-methyltransferase
MPIVYLIPSLLHEEGLPAIPLYILHAVNDCQVFFVENERTARRYIKQLSKEIVIDNYEWFPIHKAEEQVQTIFINKISEGKNIGIISEAGCPGIADPGQILVHTAQRMNITVKPLVGPNSILLALMGSGMNGQHFEFVGYLPIDRNERIKAIREVEALSKNKNCTELFIETPYRNNQLFESLLKTCQPSTQLCIAAELTSSHEWIKTKLISEWKKDTIDLHKKTVIFLLYAGNI